MRATETTKRNATTIGPVPESPEITGNYQCRHCGHTEWFVGFDDHGYPGDACDCGKEICECQVTLRQAFRVNRKGEVTYEAFTGGGHGAEIGSYDRIECSRCGTQIWPTTPKIPPRPSSDKAADPDRLTAKAPKDTEHRTDNRPAYGFRRTPRR